MTLRPLEWDFMKNSGRATTPSLRHRLLAERPRPEAVRNSPHAHWYVVGTVCIGAFMGQLDASIVTLALPRLGRDLHASVGAVEWVALSYLLVLVASVTTVGHLADAVGRKVLYVYGFAIFTIGSGLCGVAPSLPVLIGARVLQALGAAMLQANSVALITEAMPGPMLARGIGVQGTAQAIGLALGPALGGALLALGGWRLIFLVNLPAGVIGFALGWLLLPRSRSRRKLPGSDPLGSLLLACSAGGVLLYLSLASRAGYGNALLSAALAGGLLASLAFVRHERRHPTPMLDLSILRRRALSIGLSSGLVSYLVLFGTLFVVPYYLSARHVGPAVAGLRLAILPIALGIAAPLAGRHVGRTGERPFTAGGLILAGCGLLELVLWHHGLGLLAGLALAGLGIGAFTPANNAAIMAAAPERRTGLVSGMLNMTRGFGTALGVAIAAMLYTAAAGVTGATAAHASSAAAGHGLSVALAGLALAALAVGLALLVRPPDDGEREVSGWAGLTDADQVPLRHVAR